MNARQLEVFRAIMRTGSITEAARLLNVTQPTVSKIIRHAESTHRLKLFETVRGRIKPTPEATLLFPHADRVFRDLSSLAGLVEELRTGEGGTVRVAASSSLASTVLARGVAIFRRRYPAVRVVSHVLPALETADMVRSHEVDIGMTLSPVVTASLEVSELSRVDMAVLLHGDSSLCAYQTLGPRKLGKMPLISFGSDSHFGELLDEAFVRVGLRRQIAIQVFSSMAAASLVKEGAGVAVIDRLGAEAFAAGLEVRPFRPSVTVPINLLRSETQPYPALCRALIAEVEEATHSLASRR